MHNTFMQHTCPEYFMRPTKSCAEYFMQFVQKILCNIILQFFDSLSLSVTSTMKINSNQVSEFIISVYRKASEFHAGS